MPVTKQTLGNMIRFYARNLDISCPTLLGRGLGFCQWSIHSPLAPFSFRNSVLSLLHLSGSIEATREAITASHFPPCVLSYYLVRYGRTGNGSPMEALDFGVAVLFPSQVVQRTYPCNLNAGQPEIWLFRYTVVFLIVDQSFWIRL